MNIIIEGLDRCGKSTLISTLQATIYNNWIYPEQKGPVIDEPTTCNILHYSNIKAKKLTPDEMQLVSFNHYCNGFDLMVQNDRVNNTHIFDRFHLGEFVYSDLYRGYDGSYVFDIEKKYVELIDNRTYLIVMIDEADNLIARDDGLSFTTDKEKKQWEIDRFTQAYEKSNFTKKILINISDLSIDDVANKVKGWIFQ